MWQSGYRAVVWAWLVAAAVVPVGTMAADKVFISVDESGQPVASDRPPSTGAVEEVMVPTTSAQSDTEKAQEEVQRIQQMADEMEAERKSKEQARAAAKDQEERRKVSCAASRSRLDQLESQPPNRRLVVDPDGTTRRVSAEEMQDLLSAARRQVVEDCGSLNE